MDRRAAGRGGCCVARAHGSRRPLARAPSRHGGSFRRGHGRLRPRATAAASLLPLATRHRVAGAARDAARATTPIIPLQHPLPSPPPVMLTIDEQLVRAPVATIFRLARDVERWPQFLPHYRF